MVGSDSDDRELLHLVSSLVCTLTDDRITTINPAGLRMLAANSDEAVVGVPLADIVASDYRFLLEAGWELLAQEDVVPLKLCRFNGELFDAELRVHPLPQVTGNYFIEIHDISKYVRSAQALREREERLQNILQSISEGILTISEAGMIEGANAAAERMFGFPPRGLLNRDLRSLISIPAEAPGLLEHPGQLAEGTGIRQDDQRFALEYVCNKLRHDRVQLFTAVVRDISERKEIEERIRRMAHHDSLTGLPNRNLLHDRMDQAAARVRRHGGKLAILFIDLDKFKPVNDLYGHKVGDALLAQVADVLQKSVRHSDTVARIGGDEFAIVLEEISNPRQATKIAAKIVQHLATPLQVLEQTCHVGASIGIALFPDDGDSLEDVVKAADQAMYRVKNSGRNGFQLFCDTGSPDWDDSDWSDEDDLAEI